MNRPCRTFPISARVCYSHSSFSDGKREWIIRDSYASAFSRSTRYWYSPKPAAMQFWPTWALFQTELPTVIICSHRRCVTIVLTNNNTKQHWIVNHNFQVYDDSTFSGKVFLYWTFCSDSSDASIAIVEVVLFRCKLFLKKIAGLCRFRYKAYFCFIFYNDPTLASVFIWHWVQHLEDVIRRKRI